MTKRSIPKSNQQLSIKILWGDAELGTFSKQFQKVHSLTVGKNLMADIRSVVWPLSDDITILERSNGRLYLNSEVPWHGIITTGESVQMLDARTKTKKNLEIRPGTFAALKFEGISVAIRVGLPKKLVLPSFAKLGSFKPSILGLVADTPYEQASLSVAIVAALIMTGAFVGGLNRRANWTPQRMSDLTTSIRLPFIAPGHFSTAPEVLQDRVDRFKFLDSVSEYYTDLTEMLTEPSRASKNDSTMMFSESVAKYKEIEYTQKDQLSQMDANISKLAKDIDLRRGYVLSMPVVRGESLDGKMQRVLDKIGIIAANAKELSEKRVATSEAFRAEADYDHKQGASIASGKDNLAEFTQKLGAGFRKTLPDEELQMQQAKSHATEATARQVDLFGKEYLQAGVINCCPEIIGIKAGSTPITYTPMPRFRDGDQKLALLNASRWGEKDSAKPSRIIEPIAGIIDSKAVEKAISSGRFQLQLCFELSLRRNQTAKGSMEWQWKIDTQGKISSLSLLNSTMKDDELIRCVRQRIAGWKFPKARGGSVEIRYPFEFVRDRG